MPTGKKKKILPKPKRVYQIVAKVMQNDIGVTYGSRIPHHKIVTVP